MRKDSIYEAVIIITLLFFVCAAGCTTPTSSQTGSVTITDMDIIIPQGQPPSNTTAIEVVPYIDAQYSDQEDVEVQVSAKYAGTDVVVAEQQVRGLALQAGKTHRETIGMDLENGHTYDIWVSVWQDGRRQASGSVPVSLPDRTAHARTVARSLLAVTAVDVMTPDLEADRITLEIHLGLENIGLSPSGAVEAKVKAYSLQTGITAARESADFGTLAGNRSTERSIRITVPNGYDYEIGIDLFENNALITSATGRVTLARARNASDDGGNGETTKPPVIAATPVPTARQADAQVGQFRVVEGGEIGPTQPGFTAACALLATGAVAYLVFRRRRER